MQNPPIIITAFYELNLAKTTPNSYKAKRTVSDYLEFFSFFAGLQNMIVIYTGSEIEDKILEMRKAQNLGDKTLIIKKSLNDFAPKERKIIENTFAHYNQAIGRFDPTHPPHTSAEYNYLMFLKSFFVVDYISNYTSNLGGGIVTIKILFGLILDLTLMERILAIKRNLTLRCAQILRF